MMRGAFDATMKDPEFIAEAQKQNLDLDPKNGDYLDSVIARALSTPKPIIEKNFQSGQMTASQLATAV